MAVDIGLPEDGIPNQGWKLYIVSLVFVITAGLVVIARCTTRAFARGQSLGPDDYTILVSLLFSISLSVFIQLAVVNGYGKHKADLSKLEFTDSLRWFFIAQTPYKVVVCLNKVSLLLLYMRIFVTRSFRTFCFIVMAVIVIWSLASVFATIFQCVPLAASWDKNVDAECIDTNAFWMSYAVLNILTDVMVLGLPIPQIMRLQLRRKEKIMVSAVFLMGSFVTVTSIMRVTAVANSTHNKADITWNFIPRGIWTLIEANTGMICACMPVLRLTLQHVFPCLFSKNASRERSSYYGSVNSSAVKHVRLGSLDQSSVHTIGVPSRGSVQNSISKEPPEPAIDSTIWHDDDSRTETVDEERGQAASLNETVLQMPNSVLENGRFIEPGCLTRMLEYKNAP